MGSDILCGSVVFRRPSALNGDRRGSFAAVGTAEYRGQAVLLGRGVELLDRGGAEVDAFALGHQIEADQNVSEFGCEIVLGRLRSAPAMPLALQLLFACSE